MNRVVLSAEELKVAFQNDAWRISINKAGIDFLVLLLPQFLEGPVTPHAFVNAVDLAIAEILAPLPSGRMTLYPIPRSVRVFLDKKNRDLLEKEIPCILAVLGFVEFARDVEKAIPVLMVSGH